MSQRGAAGACPVEPGELEACALGALSGARVVALELHLDSCDCCATELGWLREERALLLSAPVSVPLPAPLWSAVMARLSALRGRHPRTAAPPRQARCLPAAPRRPPRPVPPRLPALLLPALAIALALLAIGALLWLWHTDPVQPLPLLSSG